MELPCIAVHGSYSCSYSSDDTSNVPYSFHPFTLPWTDLITNDDFRLFTTQVDLNLINNIVHLNLVGVLGNPINFKEMLVLLITH